MKRDDDDTGELLTIWVTGLFIGALLAMAVLSAGCSHRSQSTTQETTKTTWQARETTTATSTATSVKSAASRKLTRRHRIVKKADGTVVESTTVSTTDSGETSTTAQAGVSAHVSTAGGEAASQSQQTKRSETRTDWLDWAWLALLVAYAIFIVWWAWDRWGPGLWARVLGVFRRGRPEA